MVTGYESIAALLGISLATLMIIVGIISVWELIWKGIALWKCGRNNQPIWFLFILIINSIGILPIVYLLFFNKRKQVIVQKVVKKVSKKKRK